ncbi:MAG TPA: phosphoglycerate dehydrogenase [Nitrospiria bacterium]|nr:phosphoglycerate dehydrogenase [Nitrospiria bacterium]
MPVKVLVSDKLSEQGVEILKRSGLEVDVKTKLTPEELIKEIKNYDGLVVRSATKVTAAVIAAADRLKVIGRAGSGLDNVDINAASKKGIVVMNTPGGNTITTAEHAISMMCSMARLVPQATASMKAGQWEKNKFNGVEMYNKTLGIIGIGQIGGYFAKVAQGMGMHVIGYDPYLSEENAKKMGIKQVDLDAIFRQSDFITIHTPLTAETKNLINKDTIAIMKKGVRIINCARGGIINETDLYDALKSGQVAGAALDVFEKEPVDPKHPLLTHENFIATPHLGASTTEAQENVAFAVAEQIVDYLVRGVIRNAVNLPSVSPDLLPEVQLYLTLAEKLGSLQSQLYEGGLQKVEIEYRGRVSELSTAQITIAVLKGLLSPILENSVNYVNAPIIAKERGISVHESKTSDAGDFSSMIVVRVHTAQASGYVAGALYSHKDPRIVEIDGFTLEVVPEGCLLLISNNDKPGVVGNLGTLLGDHGINIARLQLSREKINGKAISVISVDTPVPAPVVAKIKKLPNILSVKQIVL